MRFFLLFITIASHFLSSEVLFVYNSNSLAYNSNYKNTVVTHELRTGHYNNEVNGNGYNATQLVNYRTAKTIQIVKILLIGLFSLLVSIRCLKYSLKCINSQYAHFLKLLLFPKHVFW